MGSSYYNLPSVTQTFKEKLTEQKYNRIHLVNSFQGINRLTAGTMHQSGQVVLNRDCLSHAKSRNDDRKRELLSAFEKHKQKYFRKKEVIKGILDKYDDDFEFEKALKTSLPE